MCTRNLHLLLSLLLMACVGLAACSQRPRSTADVPVVLSHTYRVSVAPFSQPISTSELIQGQIPEPQGKIEEKDLLQLDRKLQQVLTSQASKRQFVFLKAPLKKTSISYHDAAQPMALKAWLAYGRQHNCDLLLVPFVLDWHQRQGSRAGVTQSAAVHVEFFLLKIASGTVMARSVFDEKQRPLSENFLELGSFLKRRGSWVEAEDLATEGMIKAKKELGL
ncbi:MAG: hypothetical protein K6G15_00850 [Desulfovibrio sp.]|nr:hypothetical protein [Desulfovibrio sp.]